MKRLVLIACVGLGIAACSVGGNKGTPVSFAPTTVPLGLAEAPSTTRGREAQAAFDAFGSNMRVLDGVTNDFYVPASTSKPTTSGRLDSGCKEGVEFFAPDLAGDANSTETKYYFYADCSDLERDTVRIYTSTGTTTETVTTTSTFYKGGAGTATMTAKSTSDISQARIGTYGYPKVKDGFADTISGSWTATDGKNATIGADVVIEAPSAGVSDFCLQSAGYGVIDPAKTKEQVGWTGNTASGATATLTANGDGSYSVRATLVGDLYVGSGFAIVENKQGSSCPVPDTAWTIRGGEFVGPYSYSLHRTYTPPSAETTVTGTQKTTVWGRTLKKGGFAGRILNTDGKELAHFLLDRFGSGTLTFGRKTRRVIYWGIVN